MAARAGTWLAREVGGARRSGAGGAGGSGRAEAALLQPLALEGEVKETPIRPPAAAAQDPEQPGLPRPPPPPPGHLEAPPPGAQSRETAGDAAAPRTEPGSGAAVGLTLGAGAARRGAAGAEKGSPGGREGSRGGRGRPAGRAVTAAPGGRLGCAEAARRGRPTGAVIQRVRSWGAAGRAGQPAPPKGQRAGTSSPADCWRAQLAGRECA